MNFDEKIESIYLNADDQSSFIYTYIDNQLKEVLLRYPPEHRLLVGLRASYIKQRLILEGRIDKKVHDDIVCGLCVVLAELRGKHFDCRICLLSTPCFHRHDYSDKRNLKEVYKAYMNEHKKFVK